MTFLESLEGPIARLRGNQQPPQQPEAPYQMMNDTELQQWKQPEQQYHQYPQYPQYVPPQPPYQPAQPTFKPTESYMITPPPHEFYRSDHF